MASRNYDPTFESGELSLESSQSFSTGFLRSSAFGWLLAGAALGSLATLFLDPVTGTRRRSYMRDKSVRALKDSSWYLSKKARNISNRARGAAYEASLRGSPEFIDDETLLKRVRSEFGRVVSHAKAIQAFVKNGDVTLSGPILAHEVDRLISCVKNVRGVKSVVSRLDVHETPDNVPSLQGEGKPYLQ